MQEPLETTLEPIENRDRRWRKPIGGYQLCVGVFCSVYATWIGWKAAHWSPLSDHPAEDSAYSLGFMLGGALMTCLFSAAMWITYGIMTLFVPGRDRLLIECLHRLQARAGTTNEDQTKSA